jgi:hypothetical protein
MDLETKSFAECKQLSAVVVPKSTVLVNNAFYDCGDDIKIYGYKNSSAETYAANNNFEFIYMDATIGDINNDNTVDVLDASSIQKFAASKSEFTNQQLFNGDVNGDGFVDVLDAAEIQKKAADIA